jgi:hypothetical protein
MYSFQRTIGNRFKVPYYKIPLIYHLIIWNADHPALKESSPKTRSLHFTKPSFITTTGRFQEYVQKDKQCMCNVTLRHVCAIIVAMKNRMCCTFQVWVCSLSYPVCSAHVHHLWPIWLYNIFPRYLISSMCFDFLYTFCLKKFLILRTVCWSSCKEPVSLVRL